VTGERTGSGRERPGGATSLNRLRRRCQARLRVLCLELPVPFDIQAFCRALGARRGRPIVLCSVNTWTGPCGLWVATDTTDYFFYERATSRLHQDLIVLHEIGHMVCEHRSAELLDGEMAGILGLDAGMVSRVLGRTTYSSGEEQEAEVLASLLLTRAVRDPPPSRRPADPEVAAELDRVQAALKGSHNDRDAR
jgi:hypothetical protein